MASVLQSEQAFTPALCDVADINPRFDRSEMVDNSELVSFLPMANVSERMGVITEETYRPIHEVLKGFTPFQDRDVLVAKITPCFENGKIAHARIGQRFGFGSTEFHVVRAHPGVLDDRYVFHFLRQHRVRLEGERNMTGSAGQRRVPKRFLEELRIPLPPLPEQRRIAAILDKADALRQKRRQAIAKLDQLRQSVFLEMFGDPVTNARGWPVHALSDLGRIQTGATPPSRFKGMFGGDIPFATPGDLDGYLESTVRFLTAAGADASRTVDEGATLICCIGATIGKMAIAVERTAFNQQINAIEWTAAVNGEFGFDLMRCFANYIADLGTSTTLPILNKSRFMQIEIPVPPRRQQDRFATVSGRLRTQRRRLHASSYEIDMLFDALQQRAFTGRL